ncbi:43167_t:CDS:1, partial [Gigaspora margarita]
NILTIDPTFKKFITTNNALKKQQLYQEFLNTHCRIRSYIFQIKKCGNLDCCFCKPIRMPDNEFELLKFLPDPEMSS